MVGFATSSGCSRPARSRDGARECPDGPPRTRLSLATAPKYPSSWPLAHWNGLARCRRRHDSPPRRRPPEKAAVVAGLGPRPSSSSPVSAAGTGALARPPRRSGSRDGDHRPDGSGRRRVANRPKGARPPASPTRPWSHAPAEAAVSVKVAAPPRRASPAPSTSLCPVGPRRRTAGRGFRGRDAARAFGARPTCQRPPVAAPPVAGPGSPRRSAAPPTRATGIGTAQDRRPAR